MSESLGATRRQPLARLQRIVLPALIATGILFVVGSLGIRSPLLLLFAGPAAIAIIAFILMRLPLLLFWLVPASMCWFTYMPVVHYEALVLLLGALLALEAAPRFDFRKIRLDPIEWRYVLFLLAMLPGMFGAISLWRYFGALKLYAVGLLGFEVARRGTRQFGRQAMLWGPLLFVAITAVMLMMRVAQSGVPSFKGAMLRTYLTRLSWGSSNYVSAVLVLCLPATVLAIRLTPRPSGRHWAAVGILVASLVTPLLTVSRGGFLLSAAYLLSLAARVRRSLAAVAAIAGTALLGAGILMLTPFGRGLALRFTEASSMNSVFARLLFWQAAWQRGLAHLPFGVGAGQGPLTKDALNTSGPHNFLLELFSELGVTALILWLWMFATLWSVGRRLRARPDSRYVGQAMTGTLVLAFFNMLFEPTLSGNLYHLLFWWVIGIFYGAGPVEARTAEGRGSKP